MTDGYREEALIAQAVGGDDAALKVLLTRHHERLCRLVSAKLSQPLRRLIDPEDIVQDAEIHAFQRIASFQPRGPDSFFRWIAAIALNRIRNVWRQHRTAKRDLLNEVANQPAPGLADSALNLLDMLLGPLDTPSHCMARTEALAAVERAISALPERYGQAVWLVHMRGMSVAAVAERMGRSDRAVHALCRRGLSLLKEELPDRGGLLSSTG